MAIPGEDTSREKGLWAGIRDDLRFCAASIRTRAKHSDSAYARRIADAITEMCKALDGLN